MEFGLVVSIVLMVMLGIMQYGYHFWALETAEATAREAARRLAVGTGWSCVEAEVLQRVDFPAVGSSTPAAAAAYEIGSPRVGEDVTVTVRFETLDLGLFPGVDQFVEGTSRARVEHVATGDATYLCD